MVGFPMERQHQPRRCRPVCRRLLLDRVPRALHPLCSSLLLAGLIALDGGPARANPIHDSANTKGLAPFIIGTAALRPDPQSEQADRSAEETGRSPAGTSPPAGIRAAPVKLILDTDMSGDADDAGTLALLHALADRGECELLATVVNRKDKTNASAAAVDAINTWYGRPGIPIGTDKVGPTDLQRTSTYTEGVRDSAPNDIGPDDRAPDAWAVYRRALAAQPDGSVTICSVGAFSNLAELLRREPDLVRVKVKQLVVMGGDFSGSTRPETNVRTHREAARVVAESWPGEVVWQGFEVGRDVMTGERLKETPSGNPVRRAYELRRFGKRASIDGGQPSYDQAAALFAVRGAQPEFWTVISGGRVEVDAEGVTTWRPVPAGRHAHVKLAVEPGRLAAVIEELMVAAPGIPSGRTAP